MGMPKEIEKLNNLPALFTVTESQPTDCIPSASDLNNPVLPEICDKEDNLLLDSF